jgi:hypothetical protein
VVVAATVGRLDHTSGWRRFAVDAPGGDGDTPSRAGWVRLDRLMADDRALDAWYAAELGATARGHRDLAGALIAYRLAGSLAELVVGTTLDQRRSLPLGPGSIGLRFGDAARLDEVSVSAPVVVVAPDDRDAGAAGATVVEPPDVAGQLRHVAVEALVDVFAPVVDAVRARAPFGRRGMWGTLADHVAEVAVRRARERDADVQAAWEAASVLLDDLATVQPHARTRPRRQVVASRRGPQVVVAKGTCCLVYKAGAPVGDRGAAARRIAPDACSSCPLRPELDRARRFTAWLDAPPA